MERKQSTKREYTLKQMYSLPEEELRRVASKKRKNGCATAEALEAQGILYERLGGCRPRRFSGKNKGNIDYGDDYVNWNW